MRSFRKSLFFCLFVFAQGNAVFAVINGQDATIGEFPYQVSFQTVNKSQHFCSGSILNEHYVLTAAHCVTDGSTGSFKVVAGLLLDDPQSTHTCKSVYRHEGFNTGDSVKNDIALVKVTPPFKFSPTVYPATLPKRGSTLPTNLVISGWGRTIDHPESETNILKKTTVTTISNDECEKYFPHQSIYPGQFCTRETFGIERGPCTYDSGGPLTTEDKVVVGIISWVVWFPPCGTIGQANVYTRVSEYLDWIDQHMDI